MNQTVNLIKVKPSAKWYDSDGKPVLKSENLDGKIVDTTLRHARKNGYSPSVSTILKIVSKPYINKYMLGEAVKASFSNPMKEGETIEEYADRIMKAADEYRSKAAKFGKTVHSKIRQYILGETPEFDGDISVDPVRMAYNSFVLWSKSYVKEFLSVEESFSHNGYGGTWDNVALLIDGRLFMFDVKTQGTANGKITLYSDWKMQLSGYADGYEAKQSFDSLRYGGLNIANFVVSSNEILDDYHMIYEFKPYSQEEKEKARQGFYHAFGLWKHENNYYPEAA